MEGLHSQFRSLLRQVAGRELEREGTIGGGDWSVRDLVGHVMSWEELALGAIRGRRAGRGATPPDLPLDDLNAKMVLEKRELALADLLAGAEDTHAQLLQAIREVPEPTWYSRAEEAESGGPSLGERVGQLLGSAEALYHHLDAHLGDLRDYRDRGAAG